MFLQVLNVSIFQIYLISHRLLKSNFPLDQKLETKFIQNSLKYRLGQESHQNQSIAFKQIQKYF